jgi:hypothetical protein
MIAKKKKQCLNDAFGFDGQAGFSFAITVAVLRTSSCALLSQMTHLVATATMPGSNPR